MIVLVNYFSKCLKLSITTYKKVDENYLKKNMFSNSNIQTLILNKIKKKKKKKFS